MTDGLALGGQGILLKAKNVNSGETCALKVFVKDKLARTRDRKQLAVELKALTSAQASPFLLSCFSAFETENSIYMVLEYIGGGDLFFHMARHIEQTSFSFPEEEARIILAELAVAVNHFHCLGFLHRDIKV